jgi:hypothetical protein
MRIVPTCKIVMGKFDGKRLLGGTGIDVKI